MSSIAGIYTFRTDVADIEPTVTRMAQALDIPSVGYARLAALGGRAGCVSLLRNFTGRLSKPARDEKRNLWLVLDGELYNTAELRRQLGNDGVGNDGLLDDAGLCLALFRREGTPFVSRLNGQFNLILYSETDESLLLANDRYGYRPLFLSETKHELLFASEIKAILAVSRETPEPDPIGLLQIIGQGSAVGDRTWLSPIRVMPPGTMLHITPQSIRRERYFRLRFRSGGPTMSAQAFVEGFGVKLRQAVERVMRGPARIGISLSGGLDSRCVLLGIDPKHLPITAYTFGYSESRDVRYARLLAELVGIPHMHLEFEHGYLGEVLPRVVWRNESLFPFTSSTSPYFHDRISRHMDVILNGHCGDALTGSHIRPYMMVGRSREKLIERMFASRQVVPDETLRLVFNERFYRRYAHELFGAMRETFVDIDNDELPNVADAWDMENRQRRGTFHSPSVDRYLFEARTPFLDNDLVDHLLTAAPGWRFQQQAYKKMIVNTFPRARQVPWAYTGRRLSSSFTVEIVQTAREFVRNRAVRTVSRLMNQGRIAGQDFRNLGVELRGDESIRQTILEFTGCSDFPHEVFSAPGMREIVRRHFETAADLAHLVGCLATFAMAYRLFIFQRPTRIPAIADPAVGHDVKPGARCAR